MSNQLSSPTFSASFPPEQGLSARQLVNRLAAHTDRRVEVRGRFEGGWVLWVSLPGRARLFVTSIVSFHPGFEEALDDIYLQVADTNFLPGQHYVQDMRQEARLF